MTTDLIVVVALLAASIVMFAVGRPRMDVVAVIMIVALPLTGILTVSETFAGFADPNVVLIAALFVVGAGLTRTGVTYRLGDWLARTTGASAARVIVLLMLCVALMGAVMSSTGVVSIFIPVALSVAARTGVSRRQLLMPLSFAGLISGTLTLIATTPNLVVDAELIRSGYDGLGFFAPTPFGLVILVLAIGYMLVARRWLGDDEAGGGDPRRSFGTLLSEYKVDARTHRYRVGADSSLIGRRLADLDLGPGQLAGALMLEQKRLLRHSVITSADDAQVRAGDTVIVDVALDAERCAALHLAALPSTDENLFATHSRQLGMAEVMIPPESYARGRSVVNLRFAERYELVVLGIRHKGEAAGPVFPSIRLATGDTLLVSGGWAAITRLRTSPDGYVLLDLPSEVDEVAPAANQAPYAIASVLVMVVLMVSGVVPNAIAALIACLMMGVTRCIDMTSAYRAIHWPTILLIVGMLPFALALERTGGVDLIVDGLLAAVGDAGPRVLLGALFVLTAVIGLFVSNTATAVLMAPIAISAALEIGASPAPFAMVIALAASCAFMTPVSSPVNTLVVEPGGYRFGDFIRLGVPFTLIVLVVTVLLVPVILPL